MKRTYIQDVSVRKRLFWLKEADHIGVNQACKKLGLYKSHFYYWKKRYQLHGLEGLKNRSKIPKHSPRLSQGSLVQKVLALRQETKGRGAATLSLLLQQREGLKVAPSTISKILKREGQIHKRENVPKKKHRLRYQSQNPGDRVQIDVKYVPYRIKDGTLGRAYQYTAIDDCTRVRFALIYSGHGIYYLKDFLMRLKAFFPFTIKLIQTDNHVIFTYKYTAHKMAFKNLPKEHFMEAFCREHQIRHHLIAPGEPALNGKVERSHKTDGLSFYAHHHFAWMAPLQEAFISWINDYNHDRPHWGIKGQTPVKKLATFNLKLGRITYEKIDDEQKAA